MENQETKPQNPQAFPSWDMTFTEDPNLNLFSVGTSQGMTLRDYFANSAMQGITSHLQNSDIIGPVIKSIASDSYKIADAMLKQREL